MRGGNTRFVKGNIPPHKGKSKYPMAIGVCLFCKKDIIAKKIKDNYIGRKFCSLSCKSFFIANERKLRGLPIGLPIKKGDTLRKGKPNSKETLLKIAESRKWYKPTVETRKKMSKNAKRGENSHFWKGGITPINTKIRQSFEYKLWREAVFRRDNWQCIWGGKDHGNKLNADHIKPFALFPELRFSIDNGRTLCVECHKKTDTYGWKINNK